MKRSLLKIESNAKSASETPKTVSEAIYRRLRDDIVWGRLPPGAALRSDELRASYGVGISPLRESLSRLVSERLVTSIGQRGFRVAALTVEDVRDILEARLVIESHALSASIRNGGIPWERELVASFHSLSRASIPRGPGHEAETWAAYHRQFHMALIAACKSRWLLELAGLLFDQAERHRAVRAMIVPRPRLTRDASSEHKKIFEAAIDRNVKRALTALEAHYRMTAEHVISALEHVPKLKRRGKK